MPKDFWSDYARSAGVFTIGEVFNGNPSYCGPYQKPGPLDALLNYPMYFQLKNSFQLKQSMRNIHDGVNNVRLESIHMDKLIVFFCFFLSYRTNNTLVM